MALVRILGVWFGVAVVVGAAIGSGILRTPGLVLSHMGTPAGALAVWLVGGVFALLGAICLAELATALPRSGGLCVYARRALGDEFGFVIGVADWLTNAASLAYVGIAAAEYVQLLRPTATPRPALVAGGLLIGLALLQLPGLRVSSRLQEVLSLVKGLAFGAVIAALFLAETPVAAATVQQAPPGALPGVLAVALAMQLTTGAYDGWQTAAYFAGEDVNPARNVPRAIIGGMVLVTAVYLGLNAGLLRVLSPGQLATSTLPMAEAAAVVAGERGRLAVTLLAVWSSVSLVSVLLLSAPRILHAMAADALLPSRFADADARGTLRAGLLVSMAAGIGFLTVGAFEAIATVFATFAIVSYLGGFLALLVLRRTEPGLTRPFMAWGYPWTVALVLTGNAALLVGMAMAAPVEVGIAFLTLAACACAFLVWRRQASGRRVRANW